MKKSILLILLITVLSSTRIYSQWDLNTNQILYRQANSDQIILKTSRTDNTFEGTINTDGWGNFNFNNKVGIGTSTIRSGYRMHVNGNIVIANGIDKGRISFRSDRDDSKIFENNYRLNMTSANGLSFDYDANQNNGGTFDINAFGVSKLRIDAAGNVGIGTASPSSKLDIVNTGDNAELLRFSTERPWVFRQTGTGVSSELDLHSIAGEKNFKITSSTNLRAAVFIASNAQSKVLLVPDGGNVGIGTTSPSSKLDIVNTGDNAELLKFSTERPWVFRQTNTGSASELDLHSTVSGKTFKISSLNNDRTAVFFASDTQVSQVLLVPDGGNVGIGTTNPGSFKLAVNGSIRAKEIKVETGWSDFVFYDNYKLPTLKEVEKHIKEKGHLKDIPSAKEVEKNGILLGEMDSKLLQKIEELTLYIIKMNKRMSSMETEISNLKNK